MVIEPEKVGYLVVSREFEDKKEWEITDHLAYSLKWS